MMPLRESMENEGSGVRLAPGVTLPEAALHWTFSRSGGPGGQNVNKVNTRATLTVYLDDLAGVMPEYALRRLRDQAGQRLAADPDRLVITSAVGRSQWTNRQACLDKLREMIGRALRRPRRRKPTKPSRRAIQRRLDQKKRRGQIKAQRRRPPEG